MKTKIVHNILGEEFTVEEKASGDSYKFVEPIKLFYGRIHPDGKTEVKDTLVSNWLDTFATTYTIHPVGLKESSSNSNIDQVLYTVPSYTPANVILMISEFYKVKTSVDWRGNEELHHPDWGSL